jgi:hypothetical protein
MWSEFSDEERARLVALLNAIGNLVLLESDLNIGAGNQAFAQKRSRDGRSRLASVLDLCELDVWDAEAIDCRTASLAARFLTTWPRSADEFDMADEVLVKYADEDV